MCIALGLRLRPRRLRRGLITRRVDRERATIVVGLRRRTRRRRRRGFTTLRATRRVVPTLALVRRRLRRRFVAIVVVFLPFVARNRPGLRTRITFI